MQGRRLFHAGLCLALSACVSGAEGRTSGALVETSETIPAGYLEDLRGDAPIVARTNAAGETEIVGIDGLVAPPIAGHERATLRAIRLAPDGAIWACHDSGAAVYARGAWTVHDFSSFGVIEDLSGPCSSLDARSADDVYLAVSPNLCSWDGALWDCFVFGPSRDVTLSPSHLWFVRSSTRFDDLTVIDTVSRATPGLLRLGPVDGTEALVPVPGADEVVVVAVAAGARVVRRATPDGTLRTVDVLELIPVSRTESYRLVASAQPDLECAGFSCGIGAEWSELVVTHDVDGVVTEVGHLTTVGPAGVPWRALLVHDTLRVRTATGLLALP